MFTCQTNKNVMNSATKTPAHIPSHCFLLLQRLSTALKQLLVKFPCGSWLPECWCGRLPPGRSHTWGREISRTLNKSEMESMNVLLQCEAGRCYFVLYSHKEETCAHMVWYRTDPNVPMFLKVLWSYHCQDIQRAFRKLCQKSNIKSRPITHTYNSQFYLHREQCSLDSLFAETWLAPAPPKTRREHRMRYKKRKERRCESYQIVNDYPPVWFCLCGCISLWILFCWVCGVALCPSLYKEDAQV